MKEIYLKLTKYQFSRYFIVGGIATLVDWSTFYFFAITIQFNYQGALVVAFILGSLTNYILNKIFTFRCRSKKIAGQMAMHLSVSAISLLMNMGAMYVLVSILNFGKMPSRIIVTIIMLVINFLTHKYLTFNKNLFKQP